MRNCNKHNRRRAAAQAAATQAQQQAAQQSTTLTENQQAVTNLQGAVTDLKTNSTSMATTIQDEQAKVQKQIEHPDVLHYKGITISPSGSFLAGETVYRTHATGGDIPTAFSSLPYEHGDAYALSEFYGTARQSRVALMAEGKTDFGTLRGYYEADWLGTGITSNNNQSNSYVMRERVLWAQAALNNGWAFTGGALWSLATEDRKGISNLSGDIMLPQAIDPNYVPGFVWTRQYGFRVTKTMDHVAFGVAAENPQVLYSATLAGNTPYAVLGSAGANGGNYNAAISACSPSTSIVNYTNEVNGGVNTYLPVYKTVNSCANITNISFNEIPDILVKAAIDPGFGHFEFFGIGRYAHETVYPGETTNSNLYGGLKDIVTRRHHCSRADHGGCLQQQSCSGRPGRKRPCHLSQGVHRRPEGPLRAGRGALRRHHAVGRDGQCCGRVDSVAQPLGHQHVGDSGQQAAVALRELRWRLRRPELRCRQHAGCTLGRQERDRCLRRPLGYSEQSGSGLRFSPAEQLGLPHQRGSWV